MLVSLLYFSSDSTSIDIQVRVPRVEYHYSWMYWDGSNNFFCNFNEYFIY